MKEWVARSLRATDASPLEFTRFLQAHGWKRRGKILRGATTWTKRAETTGPVAVLVPQDRSTADFSALFATALQKVAEVEETEPSELIAALAEPGAALLRLNLTTHDVDDAGVPLSLTMSAAEALVDASWGAALATSVRNGFPGGQARDISRRYVEEVRVTDIVLGSLRVTAVLPGGLPVAQEAMFQVQSVPDVLVDGMRRLQGMIEWIDHPPHGAEHAGLDILPVEDRQIAGPLIRALARFDPSVVEKASFDLPARGAPGPSRIGIASFDSQALDAARRVEPLIPREREPAVRAVRPPQARAAIREPRMQRFEAVVRGRVIELRRPSVVIEAENVQGVDRPVRIRRMPDDLYDIAITAHRENAIVEVAGRLTLRARSADLDEVERLDLI